jgi:ribosomal protein L37AE/L43A
MCAHYWQVRVPLTCPVCGKKDTWDITTHFMGEVGSYEHEYTLGEPIPQLRGVSVVLDGRIDACIGECPHCEALFTLGATIVHGQVKTVFFLKREERRALIVK